MIKEEQDKLEAELKEKERLEKEDAENKIQSPESIKESAETGKKKRKKRKTKQASEAPEMDFTVYIPVIETSVNILFTRLKWSPLTEKESKLFTDAFMKVGYKYLPEFLEKWSDELNLVLITTMIILPRIVMTMQKEVPVEEAG